MPRHEFPIPIARPVDAVFSYVTDLPRTPEWRTTVRRADPLVWEGTSAVGTRFGAVTRVAGRRWNWILEVSVWDPPSRFAYSVVEGPVPMEVEYCCQAQDAACRFTMAASVGSIGGAFGRLVVPMISWGMKREVRGHLRNLKRILESETGSE